MTSFNYQGKLGGNGLDTGGLQARRTTGDRDRPQPHADGLASDTPIPTAEGWTPIGELTPGQRVFDRRGNPVPVAAVYPQGEQPLCQVDLDDGGCLLVAEGQPWHTLTHYTRSLIHKGRNSLRNWGPVLIPPTTLEVKQHLLHVSGGCIESGHSIPLARPLRLPDRTLSVDPYILGLWLGDGHSRTATITCHQEDEPHYRRRAEAAGENWRILRMKGQVCTCSLAHPPQPLLLTRLRALGVYRNKHVPAPYLRASEEQRLALLWGLMDSDGTIAANCQAEYTSISEILAAGVLELALSLGQKATLRKDLARLYGRVISDNWRVHFSPTLLVATLPRKVDRLHPALARREPIRLTRLDQRYIRNVSPCGKGEVTAIRLAAGGRFFLAGPHMIPVLGRWPDFQRVVLRTSKPVTPDQVPAGVV